jgi:hypothetical protein
MCVSTSTSYMDSLPQLVVLLPLQQLDTDQRDAYFVRKIGSRWFPAELNIGWRIRGRSGYIVVGPNLNHQLPVYPRVGKTLKIEWQLFSTEQFQIRRRIWNRETSAISVYCVWMTS